MSRVYFILDASGEHQANEADLPLSVGGSKQGAILLPDAAPDSVVAYIALSAGHAYIQPVDTGLSLFHNHQRLSESAWLKSGDQVQIGTTLLDWTVKGDQVFINVQQRSLEETLKPPAAPPPATSKLNDTAEVSRASSTLPRHRSMRPVVAGVLGLLLLMALFVLIATPVSLHITPEPATLSLSGFPPAVPVGKRLLVLPGSYTVHATREGYLALEKTVQVSMNGLQELRYKLEELPGRVSIKIDPQVPFNLFVDGAAVATDSDGAIEIDRGIHQLRVETERYLRENLELEVEGLDQAQHVSFILQPAWAEVTISSQPDGAEVKVDDRVVGTTPLATEIVQGLRNITLSLDKHKPVTLTQTVEAGKALRLETIRLPPADGWLDLNSEPAGATVTVDDNFHGATPLKLTLSSATEHTVRLDKSGYQTSKKKIMLAAGEVQKLAVKMSPQYGVLFITSRPADAGLYVNGKAVGKATRRLRLTTRPHNLEIRKAGYATERVTVTPRPGVSQNLDFKLKPIIQAKAQAKTVATPATLATAAGQVLQRVTPNGTFQMGASRREAGRRANESRRLVQLTHAYYLGIKEVTNADFRRFRPSHNSGIGEGIGLNGDNQPVVNVSWDDAARYCNWLSRKEGLPLVYREQGGHMLAVIPLNRGYRLPSEAEWVYAARVYGRQKPVRYPWTGSYPPSIITGNFADAQIADTLADVVPGYDDGYRATAMVGSFTAVKGFYDLGGNVAEWINDFYAVYPGAAMQLAQDPSGPASGEHHVVRGSSWRHGSITELRLSYRDYSRTPRNDLGFRIARLAR